MALTLITFTVTADAPIPIHGQIPSPVGLVVANVGGLDAAGELAGPDDAYLFSLDGSVFPNGFVLLSGAGLSLPGDITNLYAQAVSSITTITVALGQRP